MKKDIGSLRVLEMPSLIDPKSDRQIKTVPPPVHRPLAPMILFGDGIFSFKLKVENLIGRI